MSIPSQTTLERKLHFYTQEIVFRLPHKSNLRKWIAGILWESGFSIFEINFIFVSDEYLLQINQTALHHDYYTDIITFPYHEPEERQLHADIYISVDRVKENAAELSLPYKEELHRVMIHGILHLMGNDDDTPENKAHMRALETQALEKRDVILLTNR